MKMFEKLNFHLSAIHIPNARIRMSYRLNPLTHFENMKIIHTRVSTLL